uniref:Uncharacterized protein n=1 Tax=viral metagenome TaxID=1070528 RepID=A0A6C0CY96_9ZZZZ
MECLKKYKDIIGKPYEGVHSYRFMGTAIVDYIVTIILSVIFAYVTDIPIVLSTIIVFVLGIILHILFGVPTNTTRYLGFS